MKDKSTEIQRIKSIINSDRFKASDVFLELLQKDVRKLFSDYFDCNNKPEIVVTKDKGAYLVEIKAIVDRIKAFGVT